MRFLCCFIQVIWSDRPPHGILCNRRSSLNTKKKPALVASSQPAPAVTTIRTRSAKPTTVLPLPGGIHTVDRPEGGDLDPRNSACRSSHSNCLAEDSVD